MSGFLPIHCVLQLLKSQAFTKHRVNIKTWIYKYARYRIKLIIETNQY